MISLSRVKMTGEFAAQVLQDFGETEVGILDSHVSELSAKKEIRLKFSADKVEPNHYRQSCATVDTAPLYIIVPDMDIIQVWPCLNDGTKFGMASFGSRNIVQGFGIFKRLKGLYICLKPISKDQLDLIWSGSLGM